MPDHRAAEWILARLTTPRRASEVIGDLAEQHDSSVRLGYTALRVALTFHARALVALVIAWTLSVLGFLAYGRFTLRYSARVIQTPHGAMAMTHFLHPWTAQLLVFTILLVALATVAAVRYGSSSSLARTALVLTCGTLVAASTAIFPLSPEIAPAFVFCTLFFLLLQSTTRRAVLCIAAGSIMIFLGMRFTSNLLLEFRPTIPWLAADSLGLLTGLVLAELALSWMQRWLFPVTSLQHE